MVGLASLEVHNSIFNITEQSNKFEIFTDSSADESSFVELKVKLAEVRGLSHIPAEELQHELYGPNNIKTFRNLSIEKIQTDVYYTLLLGYVKSPFRDFESYLGTLFGLDGEDVHLILKHFNSKIITNGISPGIYAFKDLLKFLQEVLKGNLKSEDEYNQILDMINPIQLSSNLITIPRKLI